MYLSFNANRPLSVPKVKGLGRGADTASAVGGKTIAITQGLSDNTGAFARLYEGQAVFKIRRELPRAVADFR